jgi:1,2-dihydroxy-3-keto-5-methylthiopentene dioxygenase
MQACWMNPTQVACNADQLRAEGILHETFEPAALASVSARVQGERGWAMSEDVHLADADPKDEAKIARESDEHAHMEDEVRLVLEGEGIYDVRALDERWLRVTLAPGDLLVIPAKRYHRFLLGGEARVRFVQPFSERPALIPLYRASDDETRC